MKNVLTPEETKAMLLCMQRPHFTNADTYVVVIQTDPEWVSKILPPPLQPADPIVSIMFMKCDQFQGTVVGVQARYEDKVADFGLGYVMQNDLAVIYGRDGLNEPKKIGNTVISRIGDEFVGTAERYGQELIRVEATFMQPGDTSMLSLSEAFHYRYSFKADASGIENVRLFNSTFKLECKSLEVMQPKVVKLNETVHDIYGNIPVKNVAAVLHAYMDCYGSGQYLADVDPEAFLPYAFWRHDDYTKVMKTW